MSNPFFRRDAHEDEEDSDWEEVSESTVEEVIAFPFPTAYNPDAMGPSSFRTNLPPEASQYLESVWGSRTRGPPSTLQTSTSTYDPSAQPDHAYTTSAPTSIPTGSIAQPTSTESDDYGNHSPLGVDRKGPPNHAPLYAAAAIVPVAVIAILAVVLFFYLRKRRQRKQVAATQAQMQEMKSRNVPVVAARYASNPPSPPPPTQPQYAQPPSHPPPPMSPASPPPVILGPIGSTSNAAYFTGIDTSDVVSVNDRTGLGDPFADGNSVQEEPPPPYRPRSLAPSSIGPSSRNSSLRHSNAAHSQTNLIPSGRQNQNERSPFADPDEDDTVSNLSGRTLRRNQDALSVVSDLSYQEDPVVARRAL